MRNDDTIRRKRILFRCRHRGSKESDLLLGRFAESHIPDFDAAQLGRLESLLENDDPSLYAWITGRQPVPECYDSDVMALLKDFSKINVGS